MDALPVHLDGRVEDALEVGATVPPVEGLAEGLPIDIRSVDNVNDLAEGWFRDVAVGD